MAMDGYGHGAFGFGFFLAMIPGNGETRIEAFLIL